MNKGRFSSWIIVCVILLNGLWGGARADQRPLQTEVVKEPVAKESESASPKKERGNDVEVMGRVIIYLIMLGALGAFFVYYFKRGKFSLGGTGKGAKLKVLETRVLGGKQFLVVVEYEEYKILLGVGPGMIQKVCDLGKKKEVSVESSN